MAELAPKDRLQPFLLQRLKGDPLGTNPEGRDRRVISPAEYRQTLLEDLAALLNSGNHLPPDAFEGYPESAKSVLNFGVTELAGTSASNQTGDLVARMVKTAIATFEPRILKHTLEVRAVDVADDTGSHIVELEIRAEVWNVPAPESLFVRTAVDLDTGRMELRDPMFGA